MIYATDTILRKSYDKPIGKRFDGHKPSSFSICTSVTKGRLSGYLMQMDRYSLFIGTERAQNELAKLKINTAPQIFTKQDIKELGEALLELAATL